MSAQKSNTEEIFPSNIQGMDGFDFSNGLLRIVSLLRTKPNGEKMEQKEIDAHSAYPENILEELRKHEQHEELKLCLQCGYSGLVGILREKIPWYVSWWVIIPMVFIFGGTFGGYGLIGSLIL